MQTIHIHQAANELKKELSKYDNDPTAIMLNVFNQYLDDKYQLDEGSKDYATFVELLRTQGGMHGYITHMGL